MMALRIVAVECSINSSPLPLLLLQMQAINADRGGAHFIHKLPIRSNMFVRVLQSQRLALTLTLSIHR